MPIASVAWGCKEIQTLAAERESCRQQAVVALRRAVTAGYCDLAQIQADDLLEPLHSCRDFQAMIMDLTFPADPFQR